VRCCVCRNNGSINCQQYPKPILMKINLSLFTLVFSLLLVILFGCSKNNATSSGSDLSKLKGGTWEEYKRNTPGFVATMKFRFFNDSNLTYSWATGFSPVKYDSMSNGTWRLIQPDTLRFYPSTGGASYGSFRLLQITDTMLYTRIYGYGDTTLFKRN
jgi:hypothetical protein